MKLDKIEITNQYKNLQIREINDDGSYHRRVIKPTDDVTDEVDEIKQIATEVFTDEVKKVWNDKIAENDKKREEDYEIARLKAEQAKETE
jgi:hypothetical protein|tara:strand:+ start:138 stop:407 length:270 start_codon:yes stop_codon:yes gene_type:complete